MLLLPEEPSYLEDEYASYTESGLMLMQNISLPRRQQLLYRILVKNTDYQILTSNDKVCNCREITMQISL
jgi:hypothetical protein